MSERDEFDPLEFQEDKNTWTLWGMTVGVIVWGLVLWLWT